MTIVDYYWVFFSFCFVTNSSMCINIYYFVSDEEKISAPIIPKMPSTIERCVRKQNILFMHNKNQFSVEYFQFIRKLIMCNSLYIQPISNPPPSLSPESEKLAMTSLQLASKFLFNVGFHTKKTLRLVFNFLPFYKHLVLTTSKVHWRIASLVPHA